MLQRLGIRGKLLAVVMVPILVLVGSVAYITLTAASSYRANSNAEKLIDALGEARVTEADLQEERTAALNYVHLVQNTQQRLDDARAEVATRYDTLVQAVDRADSTTADSLLRFTDQRLGGSGADMLPEPRALQVTAPETDGDWLVMPTADEVDTMDSQYREAVRALDTLSSDAPDELNLAIPFAALSYAVQQEADYAHMLFADTQAYHDTLEATFPKVDQGLDRIAAAAAAVDPTEENQAALAAVAAGHELRDSLPQIRAGIRSAQVSTSRITNYYTEVIDTFVGAADDIALAVPDRSIVATLQAYAALDTLVERIRYEGDVFNRLIRTGSFTTGEVAQSRTLVERTRLALEDAQGTGSGLRPAIVVPSLSEAGTTSGASFTSIQDNLLTGLDATLTSAQSADWPGKVQSELDQYTPLRDQAWDRTTSAITTNTRNSLSATYLTLLVAIGAVVGSLLIAFAISRSIVNPLRRLTTTATAVREELPRLVERVAQPGEDVDISEVQISVESQDEIGRLADAFNGVNAATLEIAREQAALRGSISEMFVNVARRDQVLLNRQLASIDEMERTEDDPNRLTRLFALDHLATRMRRNSESLLVLAGIDTGRRLRRAMPLSDVVRTASSEIELYERVDLDLVVDPAMLGHQALTAAHLFAELLENATVFSDPGSRVVVRTGRTVDGFTVEVIDTGIGMTEAELVEANARVQSSAASEILGAQRLGLFVVGRIARRLGAQVAIASLEGRGTVATVLLPSALFESAELPEPVSRPAALPPAEAYAPAAVVEGASLSGRTEEPEVSAAVDDDDSIPLPAGLEALIAADAAAAPVAEPVSGVELTAGTATSGLPTRRRREAVAEEAPAEQQNVIGLPVRATADQLNALDAEASAFTPTVPAAEVAPQTPEERSSMFRGFRSRRDAAPEAPAPAEALPEALPPIMADALGEPAFTVPALEDDADLPVAFEPAEDVAEAAPAVETEAAPAAETMAQDAAPEEPALPRRSVGGAFAAFESMRRATSGAAPAEPVAPSLPAPIEEVEPVVAAVEPVVEEPAAPALPSFSVPKLATTEIPVVPAAQSPFARSPYGAAFGAPAAAEVTPEPAPEPVAAEALAEPVVAIPDTLPLPALDVEVEETLAIPALEADEDAPAVADAAAEEAPAPMPWAQVSTPPAPAPDVAPWAATLTPPWSSAPVEDEPVDAPVVDAASEPEPQDVVPALAPAAFVVAEPTLEPDPVVAPALELEPELEPAAEATPEPEPEPEPEPAASAPWMDAAAFATAAAAHDYAAEPVVEGAGVTDVALDDQFAYGGSAHPSMDDIIAQASGEEAGRAGFFGRLFGRGRHDDASAPAPKLPTRAPFSLPAEEQAAFTPGTFAPAVPTADAPAPVAAFEPQAFDPAPAPAQPEPAPASFTPAPTSFAPEPATAPEPEAFPTAFAPAPAEPAFSPEQLAEPSGWEAAGADALAAATTEVAAQSYQPVIDTEHTSGRGDGDAEADLARAAFSELSSLSEFRPKVEKTKAGLQKRRPVAQPPVEVTPIEDEVTLSPKERDADAVRSRFSSFYSGTQRARTDVAELELSSTPEHASE
ncbi:ATP-binding protein [Demequina soli]|uniref:ATP-binding protein n=1 Tax=Demequina soli TaxID=1638987 RepID=UPI000785199F|nr:ATP-binding protein [Demequina soli]